MGNGGRKGNKSCIPNARKKSYLCVKQKPNNQAVSDTKIATPEIRENNPNLLNAIIHRACRVCMAVNMNLSSIFDPERGFSVSKQITFCTGVQLTMNDGLPINICELCLNNLQVAYSFKNTYIVSHGVFTNMVQESRIKTEAKDENSDVNDENSDFNDESSDVNDEVHHIKNILNADSDQAIKVETIYEVVDVENVQKSNESTIKQELMDENSDYHDENSDDCDENSDDRDENSVDNDENSVDDDKNSVDNDENSVDNDENSVVNDEVQNSKDTLNAETDRIIEVEIKCEEVNAENEEKTGNESTIIKKCVKENNASPELPNIEDKPKEHICTACKRNYGSKKSLSDHIRRYHSQPNQRQRCREELEKKLSCEICGGEYKNLRQHLRRIHGVSHSKKLLVEMHGENPVKCHGCGHMCANEYILQDHTRRHAKCPDCCETFISHHAMKRHRHKVHGLHLPSCGICGIVLVTEGKLAIHQRLVHMNEKLFKCDQCDMSFSTINRRKLHMVSHNPVKTFKCQFCSKRFARKKTLSFHEKIHTGEKRKVCGICDAKFVQKASLNYHMMKHHPGSV